MRLPTFGHTSVKSMYDMPAELLMYIAYTMGVLAPDDVARLVLAAKFLHAALLGTPWARNHMYALAGPDACCRHGFWGGVARLLDGGTVDGEAASKLLADVAAAGQSDLVAQLLLVPGVEVERVGGAALIAAATHGHVTATKLLLTQPRVDVENDGIDAFTAAADGNHIDVMDLLLVHPDVDGSHEWILDSVARNGSPEAVELLLDRCIFTTGAVSRIVCLGIVEATIDDDVRDVLEEWLEDRDARIGGI